ncbi:MAG: DUF3168 domain-containing protein [Armatimonadota bacterium]
MSELLTIDQFIFTTLRDDAAIAAAVAARIYAEISPSGTTYPCITFARLSGGDVNGIGPVRIATKAVYLIQAIGESGYAAIDSIVNRIDTLLHGTHKELTGGTIVSCLREQPFSQVDTDEGRVFYRRGGIYRIMVH